MKEKFHDDANTSVTFDPSHYADRWREAMEYIRDDEHTLFYKRHGEVVDNVRTEGLHNVIKFRTDPALFDELPVG